jgi:phenylalanyl-tRNA synthetase beta chain
MKVSLNWLQEFVDIAAEAPELRRRLTGIGLAVDGMDTHGSDTVFDLDVTTNRPDCLNHLGVAREIGAAYAAPIRMPKFALRESSVKTADTFSVSIAEPELCGRYCGRFIAGVNIGPSPDWLKQRLEAVGVRSINNVADITNYVLMELGQPLHAFDADTLKGRSIVIRRADIDERMTTLDGVARSLNPSVLVIADAERAVALAGIMGGAETEISAKTTNVFLESAWFNPQSIRKTARSLGMNTEASYRFERGSDIEMAGYACDRAAAMIQELAGGEVFQGRIDVYPGKSSPRIATLRRSRIETFLGAPVDDSSVEGILSRLEFRISRTADGWSTEVPSFRVDVQGEQDLLEEIARGYGYDKFPGTLPAWRGYGSYLPNEAKERQVRSQLSGSGYSEIATYSFSDDETERKFQPSNWKPVRFQNPMTEDATILRTSLVPGMLKSIQWNFNRGIRDMQFYEISKIYSQDGERRVLILGACGAVRSANVHEAPRDFNFFDLKGDIENLFELFGIELDLHTDGLPDYFHPGRSARSGNIAVFGELHPEVAQPFKIRKHVYIAEIDIEQLLSRTSRKEVVPVSRFPGVRRDFSLLLRKGPNSPQSVR